MNNVMVNKQTSTLSPQNKQNAFLNQRNQEQKQHRLPSEFLTGLFKISFVNHKTVQRVFVCIVRFTV